MEVFSTSHHDLGPETGTQVCLLPRSMISEVFAVTLWVKGLTLFCIQEDVVESNQPQILMPQTLIPMGDLR